MADRLPRHPDPGVLEQLVRVAEARRSREPVLGGNADVVEREVRVLHDPHGATRTRNTTGKASRSLCPLRENSDQPGTTTLTRPDQLTTITEAKGLARVLPAPHVRVDQPD